MNKFTESVIAIIQNIPHGMVMTYGQVARAAGSPRAARQVVRILHSMSEKHQLPWHRVINSKGEIGLRGDEAFIQQKMLLEAEGIEFNGNNAISLDRFQWKMDSQDLL